ncbi:MAG: DDE-type integrase/transposase/recombinase [Alphaproteobacteria bacterium]|nr:DDE-type integrase/transposase/recombinase [Alphaproteobacteria bacterium]MDD9919751.1 DDE-type integrase/transposase/recombinase [Alphaproteobacteria bacterium]
MAKWFLASEIAGFPDLPETPQGITRKASRENWLSRPRKGRGGGKEFHISNLPEAAQKVLLDKDKPAEAPPLPKQVDHVAEIQNLTAKSKDRLDARLFVLEAWSQFKHEKQLAKIVSMHLFSEAYNTGNIEVEGWVRNAVQHVSQPTISRWLKLQQEGDIVVLASKGYGKHRKNNGKIDGNQELKDFIIASIYDKPHLSPTHLVRLMKSKFKGSGFDLPTQRTLQRWLSKYKADNAIIWEHMTNPDSYRNKYQVAHGQADFGVLELNQLWELDSTPADVMCIDGRFSILGVIDVYSRRTKVIVTKTSKATAVCALMRKAMLDWGVPDGVKTDNGADYVSRHFKRALTMLDIRQEICPPYTPQGKPHIERFFGTMTRDLFELLPGYVGHNVADRKEIEERKAFASRLGETNEAKFEAKLTSEQLQKICDDWIAEYEQRPHSGLNNRSPLLQATSWTKPLTKIENPRTLDILLAEAPGDGTRKVTKKGIKLDSGYFTAPELALYVGSKVRVLHGIEDIGQIVVYSIDDDADYICTAECAELVGYSRQEAAAAAKRKQAKEIAAKRKEINALKRSVKPHEAVEALLEESATTAHKVASFPQVSEPHVSAGLDMAKGILDGAQPPKQAPLTENQKRIEKAVIAELKGGTAKSKPTKRENYLRWKELDRKQGKEQALTKSEQLFWQSYQTTPEFKSQKQIEEEFSPQKTG